MITPDEPVMLTCDRQQISRSLTNILKNAAESITAETDEKNNVTGRINLILDDKENQIEVSIMDTGKGFQEELLDRITEPYVTTRDRGAGLGLAIATKIMEDHDGEILLRNLDGGGAKVTLVFRKS